MTMTTVHEVRFSVAIPDGCDSCLDRNLRRGPTVHGKDCQIWNLTVTPVDQDLPQVPDLPLQARHREMIQGEPDECRENQRDPGIHPASARFRAIQDQLWGLHLAKARGYGTPDDPLANLRAFQDYGKPAWIGVAVRLRDKMQRLTAAVTQAMEGKPIEMGSGSLIDDWDDISNYGILGRLLYEETIPPSNTMAAYPSGERHAKDR